MTPSGGFNGKTAGWLFYKLLNGVFQILQCLLIPMLHCIHNTVGDMILQNDFANIIDGGADSGNLNQNLTAVPAVFHHPPDSFHMADGPGHPVQHSLGLCVAVRMCMSCL